LGLGLAISRSIAEAHGGTLSASSPGRDQGATFTLTVPAVAPAASEERAASPTASGVPEHRPYRVLLVEDDAMTARIMAKLLRDFGHTVTTANTVAAAWEAASSDLDVVVSDIGLPDGSGLDMMCRLKSEYDLRGIALTGFGADEDIVKSREAGFAAHLTKPIDFVSLEAMIQKVAR
jgi:CheY-like chemotaxis protein